MIHGCDLREGKYADHYVSKWGLEDEVTKGHTKKAKKTVLPLGIYLGYQKQGVRSQAIYFKFLHKLSKENVS